MAAAMSCGGNSPASNRGVLLMNHRPAASGIARGLFAVYGAEASADVEERVVRSLECGDRADAEFWVRVSDLVRELERAGGSAET